MQQDIALVPVPKDDAHARSPIQGKSMNRGPMGVPVHQAVHAMLAHRIRDGLLAYVQDVLGFEPGPFRRMRPCSVGSGGGRRDSAG